MALKVPMKVLSGWFSAMVLAERESVVGAATSVTVMVKALSKVSPFASVALTRTLRVLAASKSRGAAVLSVLPSTAKNALPVEPVPLTSE